MAARRKRVDVSVVVPSIGTTGMVGGRERVFVVEAIRSVIATATVPIEVIVVAGAQMPAEVRTGI